MSDLPATTGTGLPANVAGALAYLLGPLTGIIFLVIEKENRFVRFHAAQSIVIGAAIFVASVILMIASGILALVPIIGLIIGALLSLTFGVAVFALWIVLMFRAYQGAEWEFPVASDFARRLVAAPSA